MSKELIFSSIIDLLTKHKKIVIVSHVNPDGDALGSSLALCLFAKKMGADARVIVPNDYPEYLSWMPSIQNVLVYDKNVDESNRLMSEAELFCYLDFNTESRTGIMHNDLCRYNKVPKILIDHHIGADRAHFVESYSETEISSTSELR